MSGVFYFPNHCDSLYLFEKKDMPGYELWGEEEQKEIKDVIDSSALMRYNFEHLRNGHWKAQEWETAIAEKLRVKHVQLTSSGTTALMTAIRSLGIGAGDEIIMPTFTFVASFEAILFIGAIPVLADVDETLTLSPVAIRKAISPRTKAIMPVHMCGSMADMNPIMEIAQAHNLHVIEDACQAIGATYNGKYLGTIGQVGCYSFDFVKTITSGEGGAVLTNDKTIHDFAERFSDHGHDHIGNDRGAENHPIPGLNFRISELHAAVGLAQWRKLDSILQQQRKIKSQMKEILAREESIRFRKIPDPDGENASFLSIFLEDENLARMTASALKKNGIGCAYWYDNNWHYVRKWNHFKHLKNEKWLYREQRDLLPDYQNQDFSVSDNIIRKTISFPLSLNWTEQEVTKQAEKILQIIQAQKVKI
ncbi:MAG: DegT/DnrJ/EryC1/StrS family aminotransferase [Moheibacter sp.]